MVKHYIAKFRQVFHKHDFNKGHCKSLHIGAVWPFKDPLLKICSCGATRVVENK